MSLSGIWRDVRSCCCDASFVHTCRTPRARQKHWNDRHQGRTAMHLTRRKLIYTATIAATIVSGLSSASAQKKYDTGATDPPIKIGNIMPYSGPASAYAPI